MSSDSQNGSPEPPATRPTLADLSAARVACGHFLGQDPGFFEAEIAWATVERLTDNHMIKHVD
jgi:hypothetical protein